MLFSNTTIKAHDLSLDFGVLHVITLGEHGRGRRPINLIVPKSIDQIKEGLSQGLTMGKTKTNKPKLIIERDDHLFLLLETRCGYTRRGDGFIKVQDTSAVDVLAAGNSADGDAGRIGTADARVVEVLKTCWIRVTLGGGYDPFFLYCDAESCSVTRVEKEHMDLAAESLPIPENWKDADSWILI